MWTELCLLRDSYRVSANRFHPFAPHFILYHDHSKVIYLDLQETCLEQIIFEVYQKVYTWYWPIRQEKDSFQFQYKTKNAVEMN